MFVIKIIIIILSMVFQLVLAFMEYRQNCWYVLLLSVCEHVQGYTGCEDGHWEIKEKLTSSALIHGTGLSVMANTLLELNTELVS